jgi:hypothetical protein
MRSRQRTESTRFRIADVVRVRDCIASQHVGRLGRIFRIEANRYARTLDKYWVRFASGAEARFWDIQLESDAHKVPTNDWDESLQPLEMSSSSKAE